MKIQFTKEQHKAFQDLRTVFDMTNQNFVNKHYKDYIPIGLALVHMTTAEDYYRHDLENYGAYYNQRIMDNSELFRVAIIEDRLPLLSFDRKPYEKGFWHKHYEQIEKGHDDNYFGLLISLVSYYALYQLLISQGYSPQDERLKAINNMQQIMNHPNDAVNDRFHNNDYLYHAIKDMPVSGDGKHKNTPERREATLLQFLKDKLNYSPSDDCIDLRDSDWPDRKSLWVALNELNPIDFKHDASKDLIDKFFNNQKYVSFSTSKNNK